MKQMLIRTRAIVTMDRGRRILPAGGILVEGNRIARVLVEKELPVSGTFTGEVVSAENLVAIPGFVQTHIHLCQTLFRGLADDLQLLDWLKLKIFPYEAAHNARSMYISARLGLAELIRSGTTTIMDMGSIHYQEEVVRAIVETGLRAFVGKAMMDENEIYPRLKEPTKDAVASTARFAEQFHNTSGGRIRYAVAPRFVLSCSESLLKQAYEMTLSIPGMLFHTHAAENRHELDAVRKRCGMDNIEYFDSLQILSTSTCLAHCIWLNPREVGLLSDRNVKVLHCPSSNLKLGSGVARIPELRARGIVVSLGADGAPCNNSLDMFTEMRLAALIQKPAHGPTAMDAYTTFAMATNGGAQALGLEHDVGSLEEGKKADLVLLDLGRAWNPPYDKVDEGVYSSIVYSCNPENVHSVMVDGNWLYQSGQHVALDEGRIVCEARDELRRLLGRLEP